MKLVDERGKLFGKLNIIDLLVILLLIVAVALIGWKVTRKDGSVKEFEVDSTLIFDKSSGKWIVHDMVNLDIQEEVTMVRLTYKDADNNVLSSEFVDAHTTRLTPPAVTAPEGQEFIGWFMETVDESGNTTLTLKFPPAENGSVNLSGEQALEPMVLVPRFENAEGNA